MQTSALPLESNVCAIYRKGEVLEVLSYVRFACRYLLRKRRDYVENAIDVFRKDPRVMVKSGVGPIFSMMRQAASFC
jgi:hypothetical protein